MSIYKRPYELSLWHDTVQEDNSNFNINLENFKYGSQFDFKNLLSFTEFGDIVPQTFQDQLSNGIIDLNCRAVTFNQQQGTIILVVPMINEELFNNLNSKFCIKASHSYRMIDEDNSYIITSLPSWSKYIAQISFDINTSIGPPPSVQYPFFTCKYYRINSINNIDYNCGLILQIKWKKGRNQLYTFNKISIPYIDINDYTNEEIGLNTSQTKDEEQIIHYNQYFPNFMSEENPKELWIWDKDYYKSSNGYLIREPSLTRNDILEWYTNLYYEKNNILKQTLYGEIKDIVIDSNILISPYHAKNTKLVSNINGSNTLTFTLYTYFYDEMSTPHKNPIVDLIKNESKLKLRVGEGADIEWYEFIVKNIVQNSDRQSYTYTCTDRFVNELSKQGYNVEFDTELMNNIGTAQDLSELTLQNTDWEVDSNSDKLIETNLSPLYYIIGYNGLEGNIEAIINFNSDNQLSNNLLSDFNNDFSINEIQGYFLPYNYSEFHNQLFLVINTTDINNRIPIDNTNIDDFLQELENNHMTDDYELIADNTEFIFNTNTYKLVAIKVTPSLKLEDYITNKQLTILYGKILSRSYMYKFDPITQKVIQLYEDENGDEFGTFIENEFVSPTLVSNYISNSTNFTSTAGYNINEGSCSLDTYGPNNLVLLKDSSEKPKYPVLKCVFQSEKFMKVAGIESNISKIKSIHKDEKYVLRIRAARTMDKDIPLPRKETIKGSKKCTVSNYSWACRPLGNYTDATNENGVIPANGVSLHLDKNANWAREMPYMGYWTGGEAHGDMCGTYPITDGRGLCGKIAEYKINERGQYVLTKVYIHFAWGHSPEFYCLEDFPVYNDGSTHNYLKSGAYQKFTKENDPDQIYARFGFFTDLKETKRSTEFLGNDNWLYNEPEITGKYNDDDRTDGRGLANAQQHLLENEVDSFYIPYYNSIGAYKINNWQFKYMIGICRQSLTEEDLRTKKIGLFLYSWGPKNINLEDIQLFPFKTIDAKFTAKTREFAYTGNEYKYNQSSQWWDLNDENVTGLVVCVDKKVPVGAYWVFYSDNSIRQNFSEGDIIYSEQNSHYYKITEVTTDSGSINIDGTSYNYNAKYTCNEISDNDIIGKTFEGKELILPDTAPNNATINRNIWKSYYPDTIISYNNEQFSEYFNDEEIQSLLGDSDGIFDISAFGTNCRGILEDEITDIDIINEIKDQLEILFNDLIDFTHEQVPSLQSYIVHYNGNSVDEGCYYRSSDNNLLFEGKITKSQYQLLKRWDDVRKKMGLHDNLSDLYNKIDISFESESIDNIQDYYQSSNGTGINFSNSSNNDNIIKIKFILIAINFNSQRFSAEKVKTANQIDYFYKNTMPPEEFNSEWQPLLNTTYEKRRTITAKESNYFNILQTICETFECWMQLKVNHDSTGKIILSNNYNANGFIISSSPDKKIIIKNNIGQNNYAGFKSSINLKDITRTIASDNIASHLIVKNNNNKFAKNEFCSIVRANDNKLHENDLFNFDYYTKIGLIDRTMLFNNLHGENGIFTQISEINKEKVEQTELLTSIVVDLIQLEANKQFYEEAYNSANEQLMSTLVELNAYLDNTSYDTVDDALIGTSNNNDKTIIKYRTKLEANKYNSIDFASKFTYWSDELQKMNNKYITVKDKLTVNTRKINELKQQLYTYYSSYIKDAIWKSDDYTDDNLYYLDSVHKLTQAAKPKLTYSFNVISIDALPEYSLYKFKVGDRTYVEDPEFFGYKNDGITPNKEEVIVTEVSTILSEPDKTTYKVQNFQDNFTSLFQRITASVNSLK